VTTEVKSPELTIPDNEKAKQHLQNKLKERKKQIEVYHRDHPAQRPLIREKMLAREICEVFILSQLFDSGRVTAWGLFEQLLEERQKKDEHSVRAFYDAWSDAWDTITDAIAS